MGAVVQSLEYDAFERVLSETGAGFQPFGFAGGLHDATTKLVRFGARDYDASTGRWTNKDPIGFAGQQGNVYLYVNGEPVNRRDRSGLADVFYGWEVDAIADDKGGVAGVGIVIDTDHLEQSGVYLVTGKGVGLNVGVAFGAGYCTRDIDGDGTEWDLNGKAYSAQVIEDDKGVCGAGISEGPGVGGSVAKTRTKVILPLRVVAEAIADVIIRVKELVP